MPSTASFDSIRLSLISALTSDVMSCLGATGFPTSASSALPLTMPPRSSPEPSSVDTYITDLLQAVTSDDVPICSSCEEGTTATFKCKDCSEMLCDPCVKAHQRVRITKEHSIVKFSNEISAVSTTNGSLGSCSLASNSPCSSGLDAGVNFCELHHEPHRLYCESCLLPICTECTLSDHRGHQLAYIQDAIDTARTTTLKLCAETRSAIAAVRDAIDNVQRASESVEIRSHQAAADVRSFIQRFVAALEEREHELLSRIDHIRQVKNKGLVAQMDNLRAALTKLSRTSDLLNESLANGSGVDLIVTNEKAATELKQIRAIRADLVPCESDNIFFIQPDLLLKNISSVGYISTVPAGNVQQQRNRVAKEAPPSFIPPIELKVDSGAQLRGAPRGRPIHGIGAPVIARDAGATTSLIFGTEGENDGQLCRPWGVCCDRNGKIIVADRSNNRIQVFHPNGLFSHKFGAQGTGPGQFDRPAGVAIDPVGRIVVADKDNHRVQLFTIEGTFVLTFGEKGCRNGQFNYPWDVAVNSQGNIVVTDTRNHRIQLFTNEGVFLNKYGFEGSATMWKHFDSPRGVCFNPSGHIVVTDFNNHRLVVVDPSFLHAQFLGQEGSGFKQFLRPQGIVCDDEGRIIVADSRNNRIQVFEGNGTFLWKCGQACTLSYRQKNMVVNRRLCMFHSKILHCGSGGGGGVTPGFGSLPFPPRSAFRFRYRHHGGRRCSIPVHF